MRIVVTIDNPTAAFQDKLLALLEEHATQVEVDTAWTSERALKYYVTLPRRAQEIVKGAVANNGFADGEDLRTGGGSLRGHSGALKRVLERGVREGWWPHGMQAPIQPQGPGFGRVLGYRMPDDLIAVFSVAVKCCNDRG
ncbi:hypothetical protein [Streptomyces sp. 1222.5]|uniref:hypothetical protein n=1 Tax=Streptomyces sp. 1222.5 TaxID=1881026 RepID=UPI003D75B567